MAEEDLERTEMEAVLATRLELGVGVPVTIVPITATDNGLPAVVVAWLGITGVNVAHALSARRR